MAIFALSSARFAWEGDSRRIEVFRNAAVVGIHTEPAKSISASCTLNKRSRDEGKNRSHPRKGRQRFFIIASRTALL
jgi:hypothetical protein